jgi:hypothetical protein
MKNETLKKAVDRVLSGKAKKAEIKTLIAWAESEIVEWESFKLMCETKLSLM